MGHLYHGYVRHNQMVMCWNNNTISGLIVDPKHACYFTQLNNIVVVEYVLILHYLAMKQLNLHTLKGKKRGFDWQQWWLVSKTMRGSTNQNGDLLGKMAITIKKMQWIMWSFLVRVDIDRNSSKKCAEVQGPPRKGSKIVVSLFETLMFLSFISPHPMVMWCLNAVLLFQSIFLSTSFIHSYSNLWSPLLYERAQPSFKFVHKKHLTWYWCTPLTGFVLLARLSSQRHRCTLLVLSHCILSALHKVLVVGNIGCHRRKTCFHIFSTKCIVARLLSLAHCSWSALTTLCIVPGSTFSPSGHFRQLQHLRACWRGSGKPEHLLEMSVEVGQVQWAADGDAGGAESWRSDPGKYPRPHLCRFVLDRIAQESPAEAPAQLPATYRFGAPSCTRWCPIVSQVGANPVNHSFITKPTCH